MPKRSMQQSLHFRLGALFRANKTCKPQNLKPAPKFSLRSGLVAVHCKALQRIAKQSTAKQCSAEHRIALHGIAMQSSALQRKATHCKAMHGVIYCSTASP